MRAYSYTRPLAWAALMASLMVAMGDNTGSANPGIFEVDLLFPQNETYTPQALMPIVFALQNSLLASLLGSEITWNLWEGNNLTSPGSVNFGSLELATLDISSNDTFFVNRITNTLPYPEGFWTLSWGLAISNCSHPEGSNQATQTVIVSSGSVLFTTSSSSGKEPDLVAATSADICSNSDASALNATSFGESCGVLGSSPTTNPCAATINSSVASSIYASATAAACEPGQQNPNVTCPTLSSKSSASFSADLGGRFFIGAASILSALLLTLILL